MTEGALDRTIWRTLFAIGYVPVARQARACWCIYCFIYLFLPFSNPFLCTFFYF